MRKSFKYRLYPNNAQAEAMSQMLETHRRLYNNALAQRKDAWEQEQKGVKYTEQSGWMKETRKTDAYLASTNFSSCQATLRRLDKSFQAFFRRVKTGEKTGYPRFKGKHRFDTVDFPSYGDGCKISDSRIYFQHIGKIKVKWHRPLPEDAVIKTVSFKYEPDGWHVIFSCELPDAQIENTCESVIGVDLGLKSFLVTSDGESIDPPKLYRQAQAKLRRIQRAASRKKKGSNRRRKAVQNVAKLHQHVKNQRKDFHHKLALSLVKQYGLIAHEDLNIKGIARTRLAKSTHDVGWGQFLAILSYKAEEAGTKLIAVPPKNTTQTCCVCGALPDIPLTLRDRTYHCIHCGQVSDRDLNAARNILRLGLSLQALTQRNTALVA